MKRTDSSSPPNWIAKCGSCTKSNCPGMMEAFEYFHPFAHYPEALIYQTSDALDRILGKK